MNWPNAIVSQRLMAATTSEREPSRPGRSIANPKFVCAGVMALGLPSTRAKWRFMFGNFLTACTIAYPNRWVKLILPPRVRFKWLLITIRLSIINFAGMARTLVAVGTSSDAFIFFTTAAAAPRSTWLSPPSTATGTGTAFAGWAAGAGAGAAAAGAAGVAGAGVAGAAGAAGAAAAGGAAAVAGCPLAAEVSVAGSGE